MPSFVTIDRSVHELFSENLRSPKTRKSVAIHEAVSDHSAPPRLRQVVGRGPPQGRLDRPPPRREAQSRNARAGAGRGGAKHAVRVVHRRPPAHRGSASGTVGGGGGAEISGITRGGFQRAVSRSGRLWSGRLCHLSAEAGGTAYTFTIAQCSRMPV